MGDNVERAFEHLTEQRSTLARRLVEKKRDIDALELVGKVPTEANLMAARQERDESWREVRKALEKPAPAGQRSKATERDAQVSLYEEQARSADEIADRLRREAERVSRLAVLVAERQAAEAEQISLAEKENSSSRERRRGEGLERSLAKHPGRSPAARRNEGLAGPSRNVLASADQLERAKTEIAALEDR